MKVVPGGDRPDQTTGDMVAESVRRLLRGANCKGWREKEEDGPRVSQLRLAGTEVDLIVEVRKRRRRFSAESAIEGAAWKESEGAR